MADDAGERLIVMLEARIAEFEKRMKQAERTGTRSYNQLTAGSSRATKRMQDDMNRSTAAINRSLAQTSTQIGAFSKAFAAAFVGSAAVRAVSSASQQFTRMRNALKVTGLEGDNLNKTFSSLFQIAQKNGTAIEPLVTLYGRAVQAQKELNLSSQDLLKFTDGVSTALKAAGTDSAAAAGGLLQLSQALGSGVVRAQEFNSVNEQIPTVMQAVAAGLKEAGGSVGELRKLVNDGKVSSEAFVRAFMAGMPLIEAQAKNADDTISQANERIGNAFLALVGHIDDTIGASRNAAKNLKLLGGVIEELPGYFDAALKKLETFQKYLANIGNSPVWMALAKFMGAPMPTLGPGGQPPELSTVLNQDALDRLNRNIETEETRLQEVISNTLVKADQRTIETIEGAIAGMKAERDRLIHALKPDVGPGGRIAEGARDPLGQEPWKPKKSTVSLDDFTKPGDKSKTAGQRDPFDRSTDMIAKRIELMKVEAATIDLSAASRDRARVVVELETAARRANEAAGKKNTEVTDEQRQKIELLADAYGKARGQLEALNGPLATFARESQNVGQQLEHLAVNSLDRIADDFGEIVTGTKTVEEAFRSMAQSIIAELAKIAIKKAILGPLASLMGGGGGGIGMPLNLLPFDGGGFTGRGDRDEAAGVVHRGEYVFSKPAVDRIGIGPLDRLHKGYASGGLVGPATTRSTPGSNAIQAVNVTVQNAPAGTTADPAKTQATMGQNGQVDLRLWLRSEMESLVAEDAGKNGVMSRTLAAHQRGFNGR